MDTSRTLLCFGLILVSATVTVQPAASQNSTKTTLYATRDRPVVIESASCIEAVNEVPGLDIVKAAGTPSRYHAIYSVPAQSTNSEVILKSGGSPDGATPQKCATGTIKTFDVIVDSTPAIPADSLNKSFIVLLTAFVLALLLESAFALLFNWRLFQEFFVGKSWRTPIMFVGALIVVRNFDLDLMAKLFDSYNPRSAGAAPAGNWFTSGITAMILAGGSIGVNRILVALGFRSQVREELQPPALDEKQAWIAIQVLGEQTQDDVQVMVDESANLAPETVPPATVGILRSRGIRARLWELLFPNRNRVPQSGGRLVSIDKVYRIMIERDGIDYDTHGNEIADRTDPKLLFRFGSRAIVDFVVTLPSPPSAAAKDSTSGRR